MFKQTSGGQLSVFKQVYATTQSIPGIPKSSDTETYSGSKSKSSRGRQHSRSEQFGNRACRSSFSSSVRFLCVDSQFADDNTDIKVSVLEREPLGRIEVPSPVEVALASPPPRLNIHSHTSKSLNIKDLGSGENAAFGEHSYPDLIYVSNNLVEPFALAASESPTVQSTGEQKESEDHSDLAVDIVDQALADPADSAKTTVLAADESKKEEPLFASPQEKSEIITSFILENLIIEAVSEEFCLNKFLTVLGPHQKQLELSIYSKYLDRLFSKVKEASSGHESVARKLNTPIGHSDLQRLLLATPTLGEQDQETLAAFEYEPVLDIRLYISLEEELREGEFEQRGMDGFEMEKEHILHKMLFDALNECLDYRRKGGVGGQPLKFLRRGKEAPDRSVEDVPGELETAKQEVLRWAAMRTGPLMEKEPQLSYHSNTYILYIYIGGVI